MSILPYMPDSVFEVTEPDATLLRDTMGLLVTYQSDSYESRAISALMSIRRECQADYSNLCSAVNVPTANLRRPNPPNPSSPLHQFPPDYLFRFGLGYGPIGSDCMQQNYEYLSPDCQYAVDYVFQTRMNYWKTVTDFGKGRNNGLDRGLVGALWMYHIIACLACAFCHRRISLQTSKVKSALAAEGNSEPSSHISTPDL